MLRLTVRFESTNDSPALRDYANKRLSKLTDYFDTDIDAKLNVKTYPDKSGKVEFNTRIDGVDYEAVAVGRDVYKLVDLIDEKVTRQIHKTKTKQHRKARQI